MTEHIADDELFIKREILNYHIASTERPLPSHLENPNFQSKAAKRMLTNLNAVSFACARCSKYASTITS